MTKEKLKQTFAQKAMRALTSAALDFGKGKAYLTIVENDFDVAKIDKIDSKVWDFIDEPKEFFLSENYKD